MHTIDVGDKWMLVLKLLPTHLVSNIRHQYRYILISAMKDLSDIWTEAKVNILYMSPTSVSNIDSAIHYHPIPIYRWFRGTFLVFEAESFSPNVSIRLAAIS